MKKLLIAFLVILVLGAVVVAAGGYLLYRTAAPMISGARAYLEGFSELDSLERDITHRAPHVPPASGELSAAQVERFVRVQEHVRAALGQRAAELEEKYSHLTASRDGAPPPIGEVLSALRELSGVVLEARRYQVDALNREAFSPEEYSWVRGQVFQAAGIEVGRLLDLQKLDDAVRQAMRSTEPLSARLPLAQVPQKNRELVKPYLGRVDQWLPAAVFGL